MSRLITRFRVQGSLVKFAPLVFFEEFNRAGRIKDKGERRKVQGQRHKERGKRSEIGGQRSEVGRSEGEKKTNPLIFLNSYLLVNTIINPKAVGALFSINVIPADKFRLLTWICA